MSSTATAKLSVRDLPAGALSRVFARVDFNVPVEGNVVRDDFRIRRTLPTLNYLRERGAALALCSHLGRPKGRVVPELSLAPVAERLAELIGAPVELGDAAFETVARRARALASGDVLLLENVRFHPGETADDEGFSALLGSLADTYVNDAFGTAHRAHASTVGCTRHFPLRAAGLLMERELTQLGNLLARPARPFYLLLGGAKVSDKLKLIERLLPGVDRVLVTGGMAYTFLRARGESIGDSLFDESAFSWVERALAEHPDKFLLPLDSVLSDGSVATGGFDAPLAGWDVGGRTIDAFARALADAKTVLLNGPAGVFERSPFDAGTRALLSALVELASRGTVVVAGGGDTVRAMAHCNVPRDAFTHVSTGGGASLEFLAGETLPGVAALSDRRVYEG